MKKSESIPPPITIFVCGKPAAIKGKLCASCKAAAAVTMCAEALRGRREGSTCDRPLCGRCAGRNPTAPRCAPHQPRARAWDPTQHYAAKNPSAVPLPRVDPDLAPEEDETPDSVSHHEIPTIDEEIESLAGSFIDGRLV